MHSLLRFSDWRDNDTRMREGGREGVSAAAPTTYYSLLEVIHTSPVRSRVSPIPRPSGRRPSFTIAARMARFSTDSAAETLAAGGAPGKLIDGLMRGGSGSYEVELNGTGRDDRSMSNL